MAGVIVKADSAQIRRLLGQLGKRFRNPGPLMVGVAEWLRKTAREAFEGEKSPEGKPWQPLDLLYARAKERALKRRTTILKRRGFLFEGLHSGVSPDGFVAFAATNPLPYARIHQKGGRAGRGLKARIPARPYLPGPELAEREGALIVEEGLQGEIKGAGG